MPQPVKEVADTKEMHIMDMIAQERSRQKKRDEEKSRNKGNKIVLGKMHNFNADGAAGKKKNASAATSSSSKQPLDRSKPPPPPAPKAAPPPPRKRVTKEPGGPTVDATKMNGGFLLVAPETTKTTSGAAASSSSGNKNVVFPPASAKDDDSAGPEDGADEDEEEILPVDNITEDEEGFTLSELVDSGLEGSKNIYPQKKPIYIQFVMQNTYQVMCLSCKKWMWMGFSLWITFCSRN